MNVRPEDWAKVKAAFEGAIALDADARAAYLADACGGDAIVRRQVESLLASYAQAESLLEAPAAELLNLVPAGGGLTGATVASYRVEARLGAGGMGEVYQARDAKLDRLVAIKLLPAHLSADPERLRRFHAEARAASSLNHPNILIVHDFGEHDGRPFIVTEYVEGQTLRQRLEAGALPIRELLDVAAQIASALAAAHERGVLHRDVKPENVMVRPDGYVKVLDFGLAKLTVPEDERTIAASETRQGLILGTPAYMSPEQARAERVDFRSDQFSFGAMLYELATGRSPFVRASAVETAAAVIGADPESLDRACPHMPPPLRWAIERCLAKNPLDRYTSTRDLHRDLAAVHERISDVVTESPPPPRSNLPVPPTPLVGREADLAIVEGLLARDDVRWITLTGPGGVGKTRLAIQAAVDLAERFHGAVYFVPLASVRDFQLVPSVIAETLDVSSTGGEPALDALTRHLRATRSPLLLVIDNFEHVADAAPRVAELLEHAAAVKVLASSRSSLHVAAEHEYHVPPLTLPARRESRPLDQLAAIPAVRLFVERATAVRPDFRLTEPDAAAIADICIALDGLPLAIELAAARIKVLPPAALLARLDGRVLSLAGGARDRPARHQALRAAIDWSYDLLTEDEQRLFRRLAVFIGGWTLEAAEAVCDASQDLGIDVLDGVESLVDKSLARRIDLGADEPRFAMLETIREYALERLAGAGEKASTQKAHAAYCLVLAEEGTNSEAASLVKWLAHCDAEHTNLRAALDYLVEAGASEWAMRFAAALLPFWHARAHLAEGRDRLTQVLRLGGRTEQLELRARTMFALGTMLYSLGDPAGSCAMHIDVLDAYRTIGDRRGVAIAWNAVGVCQRAQGRHRRASEAFEEALSVWRELGDDQAAAQMLSNLAAVAADEGDHARARGLYQEVRSLFDRLGDRADAAWTVNFEAHVAESQGDLEAARALFREALLQFLAINDAWGTGDSLLALGHLACDGDRAAARRWFEQAHEVFANAGDQRGLVRVIEAFARLAADEGHAGRALTLAGAADALRQTLSVPMPRAERGRLDRALAAVRLGPDAQGVGPAWVEGWTMSADEAIRLALGG